METEQTIVIKGKEITDQKQSASYGFVNTKMLHILLFDLTIYYYDKVQFSFTLHNIALWITLKAKWIKSPEHCVNLKLECNNYRD